MIRRLVPLAALAVASLLWSAPASAQSCTGRFVNPISDVCWECLFPISIGPLTIGSTGGVIDTPNPSSPICFCGS
ncbi:MAG: TraU family protein, partial [Rhodospirillales bacterium]|nr:TraU family protein [Rhodospirillales bacterium]